jgi:putative ABC transport system substrate-binding protein
MRRRDLLTACIGIAAVGQPFALAAEPVRVGLVGAVPRSSPGWAAFDQRLAELGYREGGNIETKFIMVADENADYSAGVAELVRGVDALVVGGPELMLRTATQATRTKPIVVVAIDFDLLASGHVANLARPGGNVTGVFLQQPELSAKRIEMLHRAVPSISRATLLSDPLSAEQVGPATGAALALGMAVDHVEFHDPPYDYARALAAAGERGSAVMVMAAPQLFRDRPIIADLALRRGVALISPFREITDAGGLLSYGASLRRMYRRVAEYLDKIVKGAKPADLPVEQPTEFELVINLRTAKALGLTIPPSILARADEVIE